MGSNSFGTCFRVTTFGESHGPAIGGVIDGCPAGLALSSEWLDEELSWRRPGRLYTTPRVESDRCEILSGVFQGYTTGAPIALLIRNENVDSKPYEAVQDRFKPGHAQYTYLKKYGIFDDRGGGRASARETAVRVAAGAIAKCFLATYQIQTVAFLEELGGVTSSVAWSEDLLQQVRRSPLFCPDACAAEKMISRLNEVHKEGDSVGGIVRGIGWGIPAGVGEPIYGKVEALLASAMLSLPASKGFEIGAGFQAARSLGSHHNDAMEVRDGHVFFSTNHAGGTLGGITTGEPLLFRVAFKPTSSIRKVQNTVSLSGKPSLFSLPPEARHDPCVAIRAVPVVEAMLALVLADLILLQRTAKV